MSTSSSDNPHRKDDANPSDSSVERSINEEKSHKNPRKNSIKPPFLENNEGLPPEEEMSTDMEEERSLDQLAEGVDFEDLSSDKEKDTTEGEITDTHTSD